MNRARQIAVTAALALTTGSLLGLTGCKSSSSGSTAAAGSTGGSTPAATSRATSATTSTTTAAAPPAQGKLDGVPTACPSADAVMSNLHLSTLVLSSGDPSFCEYLYNGDKSSPSVSISFNAAPPGMTGATLGGVLRGGQRDVAPVSGVADAAFSWKAKEGPGGGLTLLSGTVICSIATTVAVSTADEVALANAIL
jgi:hypothetical protein